MTGEILGGCTLGRESSTSYLSRIGRSLSSTSTRIARTRCEVHHFIRITLEDKLSLLHNF